MHCSFSNRFCDSFLTTSLAGSLSVGLSPEKKWPLLFSSAAEHGCCMESKCAPPEVAERAFNGALTVPNVDWSHLESHRNCPLYYNTTSTAVYFSLHHALYYNTTSTVVYSSLHHALSCSDYWNRSMYS
jgi:imidazoleglycerol phosphate synthase glutamine amidotransferase subunit HisH